MKHFKTKLFSNSNLAFDQVEGSWPLYLVSKTRRHQDWPNEYRLEGFHQFCFLQWVGALSNGRRHTHHTQRGRTSDDEL
jgi:hypothetical protein